jgi:hypothetical protein
MPTNANEAMKSDSLAARLGGRVARVVFDPYRKEWAVIGTFSSFPYSFHGNGEHSRKMADDACDELQRKAEPKT